MKLNEIHEYDEDDSKNSAGQFIGNILTDLEHTLGDWGQERNSFIFNLGNDEKVEVSFYYKNKPKTSQHHQNMGSFTLINAHSVQVEIYFPKQPMNIANLHDDPEIQKKLQDKMKRPLTYFEKNPDILQDIFEVMLSNGADAVSVDQKSIDFHGDDALQALTAAVDRGPEGMYHYVRFDFIFLTEPLAKSG